MKTRYLHHITLATGHTRRSYREEVEQGAITLLQPLIRRALTGEQVPLPGGAEPACTITGGAQGRCCSISVIAPPLPGATGPTPIVEVGIAPHSLCGARLWRRLHDYAGKLNLPVKTGPEQCPPEPWAAVLFWPGLAAYPAAVHWLGDLERCLAWAWIELPKEQRP